MFCSGSVEQPPTAVDLEKAAALKKIEDEIHELNQKLDKSTASYARVRKFYQGLSPQHKLLAKKIAFLQQTQLLDKLADCSPTVRRQFCDQVLQLEENIDGGIIGYVTRARKLLQDSKDGVNPLADWIPSVPDAGQSFSIETKEYEETEAEGIVELGHVGFVLVAGGLGERLGYSGIKLGLPTEMATETGYLQFYIEYILALQKKYANANMKLPLCIMTSADTNAKTVALLEKNNYYGMAKEQITIVQQGHGVPAMVDNEGTFLTEPGNPHVLVTKPHGHGDIHNLLYTHKVAKKWFQDLKLAWLVIFQDTNGLAFHTLPLMLGVSKKYNLIMNSLAVPRKAKQAIGGITKLTNKITGEVRTINVEYNQLDPLLRANGFEEGDENDPTTGYSPFPGNINQLLFRLGPYNEILERTKGLMPEFVNPKYDDDAKIIFKKPTRLECMMQDFPVVMEGDEVKRVGFTTVAAELCFSPVKNATEDGAKLQLSGVQPGTAASGEADQYGAYRKIMKAMGMEIEDDPEETYDGITVTPGPMIVLKPNFVSCPAEFEAKFPNPERIKIHAGSTLIVRGSNVVIDSLNLKGCLIIDVEDGGELVVSEKVVRNAGWLRVRDPESTDEIIKMRGYKIERKDAEKIHVPGTNSESASSSCTVM